MNSGHLQGGFFFVCFFFLPVCILYLYFCDGTAVHSLPGMRPFLLWWNKHLNWVFYTNCAQHFRNRTTNMATTVEDVVSMFKLLLLKTQLGKIYLSMYVARNVACCCIQNQSWHSCTFPWIVRHLTFGLCMTWVQAGTFCNKLNWVAFFAGMWLYILLWFCIPCIIVNLIIFLKKKRVVWTTFSK